MGTFNDYIHFRRYFYMVLHTGSQNSNRGSFKVNSHICNKSILYIYYINLLAVIKKKQVNALMFTRYSKIHW